MGWGKDKKNEVFRAEAVRCSLLHLPESSRNHKSLDVLVNLISRDDEIGSRRRQLVNFGPSSSRLFCPTQASPGSFVFIPEAVDHEIFLRICELNLQSTVKIEVRILHCGILSSQLQSKLDVKDLILQRSYLLGA